MMAFVILIAILVIGSAAGRLALVALHTVPEDRTERLVVSAALGLGTIGYLILCLGLTGLLTKVPVVACIVLVGAGCWKGFVLLKRDLRSVSVTTTDQGDAPIKTGSYLERKENSWLKMAAMAILVISGVFVTLSCFVPPSTHEWDALAYHLAAPKVFLEHGRIVFLPTDHHSNFPFLVQMLFTIGLLLDGFALANLFHFTFWALTLGALVAIGRRHFGPGTGWIAAIVFATTPISLWEAGASYIEHGLALYALLALGSALEFRRTGDGLWLGLAGVLMGFALATKTLALVPATALLVALAFSRAPVKQTRRYVIGLLLIGCPFYLKSWIMTRDPVYPFGYKVFHGKYWNEELSQAYQGEQKSFGLHRDLVSAREDWRNVTPKRESRRLTDRIRNTFIAPFTMISIPRLFYNYNDPGHFNHLGFLFLALPPLLLFRSRNRLNGAVCMTACVGLMWYAVSAQAMQYARYFLPIVPIFGLLGGAGVVHAANQSRMVSVVAYGVIGLQAWLALSQGLVYVSQKVGAVREGPRREKYIENGVNILRSCRWINENSARNAGVVLFEENRGFYLDRPYIWGNYFHSRYIPYEKMANGREMAEWFLSNGIRYALVNLQFSPKANSSTEARERLREAVRTNTEASLLLEWYGPNAAGGESWRTFIGESLREGAATVVPEACQRGVVVIEFRSAQPGLTGSAKATQAGKASR